MQRQLDAYNAHDLQRFVAEYTDDIQVFRPPAVAPVYRVTEGRIQAVWFY